MNKARFEVRVATRADKREILSLCKRAVRRDYVPMFLDEFIRDGSLFVAFDQGRAVGIVNYTRCLGGDGWLGQARTDPDYRRHGVATAIIRACSRHAAAQGARHVRLWSLRTNNPAQITVKSNGFREVAVFRRLMKRVGRRTGESHLIVERRPEDALKLARGSELLRESSGYASMGTEFVKVNLKVISEAVAAKKIARLGDNVCYIDDNVWGDRWKAPLEFTGLAGDIGLMLDEAELFARIKGKREVHTYFAVGSRSLRTARRKGYKIVDWGKEAVLFEKSVRPSRA
jgi:GNAT superfamily N-acetyltransferase